jgi:phosphoglycerate kinase
MGHETDRIRGVGMVNGNSSDSAGCRSSHGTGKNSADSGSEGGSRGSSRTAFHTLDDFDVRGKRVLLRVDINSPVDEKTLRLEDGSKIRGSVPTIRELMDRGAKVVVLAHQGRPGDYDFIPLNEHATYLSQYTGKKVRYVDDIIGSRAQRAIDGLAEGECILMKNVRNLPDEQAKKAPEEHAKSELVRQLAPKFDLFINDAFGSSHRAHASLVGFSTVMPSAAGRLLEREISTLSQVFQSPKRPSTYIFGGTKFSDALQAIEKLAETDQVDHILVAGLAGYAYIWALGKRIGSKTEEHMKKDMTVEVVESARRLHKKHGAKIVLPEDAAIDDNGARKEFKIDDLPQDAAVKDIGTATIARFTEAIMGSKTVFLSGPPGVYELEEFCKGTKAVFDAMILSGAFSVIGGGHSSAAANKLGLLDKFSYVSTGGGALERFMLGREMPVIEALKASAKKF